MSGEQTKASTNRQNSAIADQSQPISSDETALRMQIARVTFWGSLIIVGTIAAISLAGVFLLRRQPEFPGLPESASVQQTLDYLEMKNQLERVYNEERKETLQWVTTSTFPMISTWVGTVLAFYFSSGAFTTAAKASQSTNEGYQRLVERTTATLALGAGATKGDLEKLKNRKLSDEITGLTFAENKLDSSLQDVIDKFRSHSRSRLLIINPDKTFRTIVQLPNILEFLVPQSQTKTAANITLKEYLASRPKGTALPVIFERKDTTLYDAFKSMQENSPACRDLLVTETGNQNEPVLAYLTDVDILKYTN